jgi:NAD(P)-dependent dehydrogenase (short-subunit alcohol dehydrogenase family)
VSRGPGIENLEGKVAVVTGAGSGIGRALALRFAAEGMRLALADVEQASLEETGEMARAAGAELLTRVTDVSRYEPVQALAEATRETFGGAHVLCNNAGVVNAGPVHELTLSDWSWVLGVNLWGAIHGVKAFMPLLLEQGEGHVVSTASTAGLVASPGIGPYNVSKFGVVALMETVARDLARGPARIGVSVLCPGDVDTRLPDSNRNRPAEVAADHHQSEVEDRFLVGSAKVLAKGMDPADVAARVVAAIHTNAFWILTHPEWKGILERRIELLVKDDALPERYP